MKKICILGLGYIGLPTAAMFATHGVEVVGVDNNPHVINTLNQGKIHIEEPGLLSLIQTAVKIGHFKAQSTPELADAFIIAVPTPFRKEEFGDYDGKKFKKADLSFVINAAEMISPLLRIGNLVVLESTSPPKTTADIVRPILEKSGLIAGKDFFLVYSPERVLPGRIIQELVENDRVIGGINEKSAQVGKELYQHFVQGNISLTDTTTAEVVKLMENTYRDVNIALANEFSRIAEVLGYDVWEAIKLANLHPRVNILNPGPGVGGHCISVDPWFLVEAVPDLTNLIYQARIGNNSQPEFVVELVRKLAKGSLSGIRITALGLTYKPNVDDSRESPAIEVVKLLINNGAYVKSYDPHIHDQIHEGIEVADSLENALHDAQIVILLVAHNEFLNFSPTKLSIGSDPILILDTVNGFNEDKWNKAGYSYYRL